MALTLVAEFTWAIQGALARTATSVSGSVCTPPPPPCLGGSGVSGSGTTGGGGGGVLGSGTSLRPPGLSGSLAFTGGPLAILIVIGAALLLAGLWSAAAGQQRR